jgi:hypothetical protein
MACLQKIFSLSLLLSCSLGFLVVDGFIVSPFRHTSLLLTTPGSPNTAIESLSQHQQQQLRISSSGTDGRQRCRLYAVKESSKKSSTADSSSSAKIQEMAAFLSIQLLEKVMAEAMKEDGESTMDLDAVQRITEALQYKKPSSSSSSSETETKQEEEEESAKLETTATATSNSAAEEDKVAVKESIKTTESTSENTTIESKNKDDASKKEEEKKISPLEIVASDIPPLRPSSIPKRELKSSSTVTEQEGEEKEKETTQSSEIIIEDNKVSSPLVDEEDQEKEISQKIETSKEEEEVEVGNWAAPIVLEKQTPGESFQRKLLEKQFEYNALARVVQVEEENDDGDSDLNDDATTAPDEASYTSSSNYIGQVEEEETTIEATQLPAQDDDSDSTTQLSSLLGDVDVANEEEESSSSSSSSSSSQGESTTPKSEGESYQSDRLDDVVQSKSSSSQFGSSSSPPLTTTTASSSSSSPLPISERRLQFMVARRQPKSQNEESKLAEKYKMMPIEERAYTLLFDLGMIDENKDPKDPSYDHTNDDEYCDQTYISSSCIRGEDTIE